MSTIIQTTNKLYKNIYIIKEYHWIQSRVSVGTLKKTPVIIRDVVCSVWWINLLFTSHAHLHFVDSDERIRPALSKTLAYQQC